MNKKPFEHVVPNTGWFDFINEIFSPGLVHLGTNGFTSLPKEVVTIAFYVISDYVGDGIRSQVLGVRGECSNHYTRSVPVPNTFEHEQWLMLHVKKILFIVKSDAAR